MYIYIVVILHENTFMVAYTIYNYVQQTKSKISKQTKNIIDNNKTNRIVDNNKTNRIVDNIKVEKYI